MAAQKKPSVRDVLWRKKHARDQMLDAVGKLCDEAWAIFEKVAADRSSSSNDAVVAREMGLRLRSLAYLIEGEHYIDRIAFELRSKEVYLKTNEVSQAYVAEMVVSFWIRSSPMSRRVHGTTGTCAARTRMHSSSR